MPHKMWKHNCEKSNGAEIGRGVEICPDCGERGQYDGWALSVVEMMGAYQRRTNLRPLGPHRSLADELFDPRIKPCPECNGRGVIDINHGENYKICPRCDMGQFIFDGTPEEFEVIRQKIR